MKKILFTIPALCSLAIVSCQHRLESESGLYNVELQHNPKVLVDGGWSWGKGNPYAHQKSGKIYIHPMNISKVSKKHPKTAQVMVVQMQDYMVQEFAVQLKELNRANRINWKPEGIEPCIGTT